MLQLIAPKFAEPAHRYGNTQILIAPTSAAALSLNYARTLIEDEHLMAAGKAIEGNHVTVRYGLLNDDLDGLRAFIARQTPFEARLDGIELFQPSDHSDGAVPVVARISAPELYAIEAEIGRHADFKDKTFPVYKPHATLAYCKPGIAERYQDLPVAGTFVVQSITISHRSGVQETIPFGMAVKWDPNQDRDRRGRWVDEFDEVDAFDAIGQYGEESHEAINGHLRGQFHFKQQAKKDVARLVGVLDSGFQNSKVYKMTKGPQKVYRGIENDRVWNSFNHMKVGSEFGDKAFLSTSFKSTIASRAMGPEKSVLLTIVLPSGTRYLSGRQNEREAILNRGLKMRVTRITKGPLIEVEARLVR